MSHEVNQELWRDLEKSKGFLRKKNLKLISRKASYFVRERASLTMTICPQMSLFPSYQILTAERKVSKLPLALAEFMCLNLVTAF